MKSDIGERLPYIIKSDIIGHCPPRKPPTISAFAPPFHRTSFRRSPPALSFSLSALFSRLPTPHQSPQRW